MNARTLLLPALLMLFVAAGTAAQNGYGAAITLAFSDPSTPSVPSATLKLTQRCETAALVMSDGSRFPVTVEFLAYRPWSNLQLVFSRPFVVTPQVLAVMADITTLAQSSVVGDDALGGIGMMTRVEVIDDVSGEVLGSPKELRPFVATLGGTAARSLERVSIDLRPYAGRTVRFRLSLVTSVDRGRLVSAPDPAFTVTRPQHENAPKVEEEFGAGGPTSPVDRPTLR